MTLMRTQSKIVTIILCAVLMLTACGPIKGYPGPERPQNEVSVITWRNSYEVFKIVVDHQAYERNDYSLNMMKRGIGVLPGLHSVSFVAEGYIDSPPCQLYVSHSSPRTDYESCENEGVEMSKCYRTKTDTTYVCNVPVLRGACQGQFTTEAGKTYTITPYFVSRWELYFRVEFEGPTTSLLHQKCDLPKQEWSIENRDHPCGSPCH